VVAGVEAAACGAGRVELRFGPSRRDVQQRGELERGAGPVGAERGVDGSSLVAVDDQRWRRRILTRATVVLVWPASSWAAFLTRPLSRRTPLSRRRPARETRTLTLARAPAASENVARPSVTREPAGELVRRRRAVSFVRPEQRPTVAAGHVSLSVMNRRAKVSRVDTSFTPANAGVGVGVGVAIEVGVGVGAWLVGGGVVGGAEAAVVKVWSAPWVTPPAFVATSR